MIRKIPKPGTRVAFIPNPASFSLYDDPPEKHEQGTVVTVPLGRRRSHYLRGPGGGLVYVDWDESGVQGVSPIDLELVSTRKRRSYRRTR